MKQESSHQENRQEPVKKSFSDNKSKRLIAASLLAGGMALGTAQDIEAKMPKETPRSEQSAEIKKERSYYVNRLQEMRDPQGGFIDDEEIEKIFNRDDASVILKDLARVNMDSAWDALEEADMYRKPWVREIFNDFYELSLKNKDRRFLYYLLGQLERYYTEPQIRQMLNVLAEAEPAETLSILFGGYATPNPYEKYKEEDWFKNTVRKAIATGAITEKKKVLELFGDTFNFHLPSEYKDYATKKGLIEK